MRSEHSSRDRATLMTWPTEPVVLPSAGNDGPEVDHAQFLRSAAPAGYSGSSRSQSSVSFSVRTEVSPALSAPISRLFGQAFTSR